ncbi:MAG: carboxypeptidase regulatory-like domain-containing protein, partial [Chloroflexota bacterium]
MHSLLRRLAVVVIVLLCAALAWFAFSPQLEVAFARNLLLYRAEKLWRATPSSPSATGTLMGVVRDEHGDAIAGATIVASDADGRAFVTTSDGAGRYTLTVTRGALVPMATKAGYDDATLQLGPLKRSIYIEANAIGEGDFVLRRSPARTQTADDSLKFFDDAIAHTDVTQPADVRRRGFTFARAGATLNGSYVYEPMSEGRFPMLLLVLPCWTYPCSTLGWDVLSATLASQGFVVVAFSPQRGIDFEADVDDVLKLIAHVKTHQLSAQGDESRVALLAGSLTSIHLWRVAQLAPRDALQGVVALGGVSDLFLIRQRFESHELLLEPPFAEPLSNALIGLGRPNLNPEFYVRYSPVYHLDALTHVRIALIHGGGDKTVPFEQTPHFSAALTAHGI